MLLTGDNVATWTSEIWADIPTIVEKFFGFYINGAGNWSYILRVSIGCGLLILILLQAPSQPLSFGLMTAALFLVIITTIQRVPVSVMHPYLAGPRYFFYPYVILSWLLIWIGASSRQFVVRLGAFAAFGAALWFGSSKLARHHIHINWQEQVAACAQAESFSLPVHFDGSEKMWSVQLSGADCTALVNGGLVGRF